MEYKGAKFNFTVIAKIFHQELWSLKMDWDEEIPLELQTEWLRYRKEAQKLNKIQMSHHMFGGKVPKSI